MRRPKSKTRYDLFVYNQRVGSYRFQWLAFLAMSMCPYPYAYVRKRTYHFW